MERSERRAQIAGRLAQLLAEFGTSQNQLAKRLRRTSSSLTGWKTGRGQPSLEVLAELLESRGRSADWLLGLSEPEEERALTQFVAEPGESYEVDAARIEAIVRAAVRRAPKDDVLEKIERRLRAIESELKLRAPAG